MINSLRSRLTLIFIGLAIGPLVCIGIAIGLYNYKSFEKQNLELQKQIALSVSNEVKAFIEGKKKELIFLDKVNKLGELDQKEQRAMLSIMMLIQRVYQEFVLTNADGQEQFRLSRSTIFFDTNLQKRTGLPDFEIPQTQGVSYYGPIRFNTTVREPLMTISVPLSNKQSGKIVSVLMTHLRMKSIWTLLAEIEVPDTIDVYITDQTGQVVAHKNPSIVLSGVMADLQDTSSRGTDIQGRNVIKVMQTIQLGDQTFFVFVTQSLSDALKPANNSLFIVAVIISISLVLAIILVLLIIQQIIQPIEILAEAANAISSGDYSQKVKENWNGRPHTHDYDEIGKLSHAFNLMTTSLQEREKLLHEQQIKIQMVHDGLEVKVRERTEQLESVNKNLKNEINERLRAERQISASLAEKEVLLKEIHHRVKNNMQIIISLLNLQSSGIENQQVLEKIRDSQSRIRSMALIHENLYQSKDLTNINLKEYMQSLVDSLVLSFTDSAVAIRSQIKGENVLISIDKAIPCGLIVNELVLNSLKYAFKGRDEGNILIDLKLEGNNTCIFEVSDNGVGIPDNLDYTTPESMGLQIVKILAEDQLGGGVEFIEGKGTTFRIIFPMSEDGS